jgi:hypothetical protein
MRKIAIVGGGQSGLQLALGLLQNGYDVTVVNNRTPEEVRGGRVMSSQCMFNASLETERRLGLDDWSNACPDIDGIGLTVVGPEGTPVIEWDARLEAPAQSVDQRLKMPAWMERFRGDGGDLRIIDAGIAELEELYRSHDLVVVASGKGEVGRLFERDPDHSPYDAPQRSLALTYVEGYRERDSFSAVTFNLIPTVGEFFWFPALTTTGPCHILVFEGIPGGPMDCWDGVEGPEDHLERTRSVLEQLMPWEAERAKEMRLTDPNGILAGKFPPTVRQPVVELPSGAPVLGMADVVVLNDPITGQGSNNAAKCADVYLDAIVGRGTEPFDREWMEHTFATFWNYARDVSRWTNMLLAPPPEHVVNLLGAAGELPGLASRIVNGFDNPPDYFPWWEDPGEAEALIKHEQELATA